MKIAVKTTDRGDALGRTDPVQWSGAAGRPGGRIAQGVLEDEILDLDSSIVERYGKQEGAWLGYNPKKHRRPSHHPRIATLGRRPWVVHAWLRSGNTSSARGAGAFLDETLAILPKGIKILHLRGDSRLARVGSRDRGE